MRVVLTTDVPVIRVAVFAEMAWLERRPELGVLCRAARGGGNRITTAVVQSALPGLKDAGANNVIAWCNMVGLCDAHGALTSLGDEVAETDEAPVPEQGVYDLWIAKHPLLGSRVLAVSRLASNPDQRFESIEPISTEVDLGTVFRSVRDGSERFVIRELLSNHGQPGAIPGATEATCRLRWTLDFAQARDQWQLDGRIEVPQERAMRPMQHDPETDGIDLWKLADGWGAGPFRNFGRWQSKERRLAIAFDKLADREVDSFCKTLTVPRVEVPGKGEYENVTLEDVPVGPASTQDAQRWAMARFERHLSAKPAYRSRAEVREQFAQLTERTPLEPSSPTLPSHDELLELFAKDAERFWSIAAPVDLAPFPVVTDELGALRVGVPTPTRSAEHSGVVRIPYRGGWSMRQLVDRLLEGVSPRRVLLCDRYVRGEDNLNALRLLVGALRAATPGVGLDVWTSDEDGDFKKVQGITGSAPRSYREVFGRNAPHDRYLLVIPVQGSGFGWHMTNSPIHARADVQNAGAETPLLWKDLAATRVSGGELEPTLRQWLLGGRR